LIEDEELRHKLEAHLEAAEEYMQQGQPQLAFLEFEEAASTLKDADKIDQLEQLWGHAASGFSAAGASIQAGYSHLHIAEIQVIAGRRTDARDSYLAAANAFFSAREKTREVWTTIAQSVEKAVGLCIALSEYTEAIDLLVKCAAIYQQETGFIIDAINSLERAKQLIEHVPDHPLAEEIEERLQLLIDKQS
jgi:tetratricopeptide (TPR) repeat protein